MIMSQTALVFSAVGIVYTVSILAVLLEIFLPEEDFEK
jgi:hypothetical protein